MIKELNFKIDSELLNKISIDKFNFKLDDIDINNILVKLSSCNLLDIDYNVICEAIDEYLIIKGNIDNIQKFNNFIGESENVLISGINIISDMINIDSRNSRYRTIRNDLTNFQNDLQRIKLMMGEMHE